MGWGCPCAATAPPAAPTRPVCLCRKQGMDSCSAAWLGSLCCEGPCTPGQWGDVGWVARATEGPQPTGTCRLGSFWVSALALLGWVGVVALVKMNGSGKWAVAGMWEILHMALSTRSQALQANPSLPADRDDVSQPCRGAQGHIASPGSGEAQPWLCVQWCEWPCCPRVPPRGQGSPLSAEPAQPPRPPCSISPGCFPSSWGVPSSANLLPLPSVLPGGGKWERMF